MTPRTLPGGGPDPADRRAHPRIPSSQLAVTRVRIPNRPAVTLVDLSSGGALINLPFQVRPQSRFPLLIDAVNVKLGLPFQLIRCYVSTLNGGVTYQAAGAFDSPLNLEAMTQRGARAVPRLLDTVERMRRGLEKVKARSRSDAAFDEMLGAVVHWLRQDDSLDLVTLKVKAQLRQAYPSLMIVPSLLPARDEFNSVACFGYTLRSKHPLSSHDRRFLKAGAQLISMLEDTRRALSEAEKTEPAHSEPLIRSAAEWQCLPEVATGPPIAVTRQTSLGSRVPAFKVRSAAESGLRAAIDAAMLQPAAVSA